MDARRIRRLLGFAGVLYLLWSARSASAATDCDRRCLLDIASAYMDSLSANDPAGAPLAAHVRSTENGQPTELTAGIWASARGWRYRHTFVDPVSGNIGAFGVVTEGADQDHGLVFAIVAVDMPERTRTLTIRGAPVEINPQRQHLPRTLLLFELFKVEDGQIREVEAMMRNLPLGAEIGWSADAAR
jgi:hypothetical protein